MPVEIVGLKEALKAMKKLQPELEKDLKTELRFIVNPIVREAKALVPTKVPGLSNWTSVGKSRQITAATSAFRRGSFPRFISNEVRAGIKTEIFPVTHKDNGFYSIARIVNQSPAGAIYETAGRKNPAGQPWNPSNGSHDYSHSRNPNAGLHFINSMPMMRGFGVRRGRLLYAAWDKDQGRILPAIYAAVDKSAKRTMSFTSVSSAFKDVA